MPSAVISPSSPQPPADPFLRAIWDALPGADLGVDAFVTLGYEPNCRPRFEARRAGVPEGDLPPPCGQCPQELFHAATEYDVLYGGAAGGGKTKALLMDGLRACVRYPGIRVGAFRRTYDELAESFLKELEGIGYAEDLGARWREDKHELLFPPYRRGGSVIRFRYLQRRKDATRRQGGEYQLLLIDERTLMPPGTVPLLMERLRTKRDSAIPVLGVRCASNPGGLSHGETKVRYIDATGHGRSIVRDEQGEIRFIGARVADNPHVDEGYQARLDAIPDPARRAAMRDGSWDSFAGQYFPEWRHDRHVVPALPLSTFWRRYSAVDWGYAKPWCVLWAALDEDGRLWVYRELYATEVGESEQARRIHAIDVGAREQPVRWGDPAMWASRGEPSTIAETYAREGVGLLPADNQRVPGWQRVHSFLADAPACRYHRSQGWPTCPKLHVFEACVHLIRTLPDQVHDETRVEDLDSGGEDHAADTLRYLVMGIGHAPLPLPDGAHTRPVRGRQELDYWSVDGGAKVDVGKAGF